MSSFDRRLCTICMNGPIDSTACNAARWRFKKMFILKWIVPIVLGAIAILSIAYVMGNNKIERVQKTEVQR